MGARFQQLTRSSLSCLECLPCPDRVTHRFASPTPSAMLGTTAARWSDDQGSKSHLGSPHRELLHFLRHQTEARRRLVRNARSQMMRGLVTTYEYDPDSGPKNLLPRGKAVTFGGVTQRTCYGYDSQGNEIWETSPNANLSSCTATVTLPAPYLTGYDHLAGGLLACTIHPAPSGQSNFQAVRNKYDSNMRLQKVDKGVLASWPSAGTSPGHWCDGLQVSMTTTFELRCQRQQSTGDLGGSEDRSGRHQRYTTFLRWLQ